MRGGIRGPIVGFTIFNVVARAPVAVGCEHNVRVVALAIGNGVRRTGPGPTDNPTT